jgi:hypothetical protein
VSVLRNSSTIPLAADPTDIDVSLRFYKLHRSHHGYRLNATGSKSP